MCACHLTEVSLGRCLVLRNMIDDMHVQCPTSLQSRSRLKLEGDLAKRNAAEADGHHEGNSSAEIRMRESGGANEDECGWVGKLNALAEHCKLHQKQMPFFTYQSPIQPHRPAAREAERRLLLDLRYASMAFLVVFCCPVAVGFWCTVLVFAAASACWMALVTIMGCIASAAGVILRL